MKILFIYFFSQSSNLLNQARLKILKTREDLLKVSNFLSNSLKKTCTLMRSKYFKGIIAECFRNAHILDSESVY